MSRARQHVGWRKVGWLVMLLLLLGLVALLAAGCQIKIGLETTIKDNGSGSFGFRMSADKEIQDLMTQQGGGDIFSELATNIPEDWDVTEGTDEDGTRWVLATVDFADKAELASLLQTDEGMVSELGDSSIDFEQETTLFRVVTRYRADLDAAAAMGAIGEGAGEDVPTEMLSNIIQFENRVTLPGSIGTNNADEVQGNSLIWRPKGTGPAEMRAESSSLRWPIVIAFIAGGLIILALIAVLIILLVRRRRPAPAAPVQEPASEPAPAPEAASAATPESAPPAPTAAEPAAAVEPEPAEPEAAAPEPAEPEAAPASIAEPPAEGEEGRPA